MTAEWIRRCPICKTYFKGRKCPICGWQAACELPSKSNPKKCKAPVETYSRIVGYYRPIQFWNPGMREQFKDRLYYNIKKFAEKD